MKKGILILLGMFMMVSTVEAKTGIKSPITVGFYNYNNAVSFYEKGIQFHVFLNGDFDFDITRNNIYYDYNGRRTNRISTRIKRDFRGRITKIGRARIYYDYRGNVRRIGNISMRYRFGDLIRVGNLRVSYNNWGDVFFNGNVKNTNFYTDNFGINFNLNLGDVCDYNDPYFYRNDFRRNYSQVREDNNFYYYKSNTNAKIGKRNKILKRRKPVSKVNTKRTVRKRVNNTFKRNSNIYKSKKKVKRTAYEKKSSVKNRKDRFKKDKKSIKRKTTRDLKKKTVRKKRN